MADPYGYRPAGYNATAYTESDEYKLREYDNRPHYPLSHEHDHRPLHGHAYPAEQGYADRVTDYASATPYGYVERRDEREAVYDEGGRRVW